ncbi:MAG TPA: SPOR domain-containing protein [Candidatus Acidoferrales bacterium]|nr:SPOR domain-containing protein [Candidatus Acidoferrales bacterium]
MASRKSGGDFILESKHLVGLFVLLVVIFGVVFTLGYLLGRGQYDSKLRAVVGTPVGFDDTTAAAPVAKSKSRPESEDAQVPKKNSDWDFYHSAEPQSGADHLQPAPKNVSSTNVPAAPPKPPAHSAKPAAPAKYKSDTDGPLIPKGAIMLQVAAVLHQDDALALAQALQQKKFPAIVLTPGPDKLYRVQVGPYPDNQTASNARQDLEAKGFKSIIKR